MRVLHLFAGAGGGILADVLLGNRTVGAVECDPYAQRVLQARIDDGCLPWFPIFPDVRTFDGTQYQGLADCIAGGFPCQDISAAGKGEGITGERSGLWSEFARIIGEVRPRHVFVENSPMLVGRGLAVVLGDLAGLGYNARWGLLGADACGFPHHRTRFWMVANAVGSEPREQPHVRPSGRVGRKWQQMAQNTDWEALLAGVRGTGHGIPNRVDRCDCIRNAQIPDVAAAAFEFLKTKNQ